MRLILEEACLRCRELKWKDTLGISLVVAGQVNV